MSTDLKIYDKIRALAGNYKIMHNDVEWNYVLRKDDVLRGTKDPNDYSTMYLTIESLADNNYVGFKKRQLTVDPAPANTYSYSLDDGETWTQTSSESTWTLNAGDKILLKAEATHWGNGSLQGTGFWHFESTGSFKAYGNTMSIIYGDYFVGQTSFTNSMALSGLFYEAVHLEDASKLMLPATTLRGSDYNHMFYGCTSLTAAPKLPATTLYTYSYDAMFYGCTSLETAPVLPATSIYSWSYWGMFSGCTSLKNVADFPVISSVGQGAMTRMFNGCTSLETAPRIAIHNDHGPVYTYASEICKEMFMGCTALKTYGDMTMMSTNAMNAFEHMFDGCTALESVGTISIYWNDSYMFYYMFNGCSSLMEMPEISSSLWSTNKQHAFSHMFDGCAALEKAWLPDSLTTLVGADYMFYGCSALSDIRCLATTIYDSTSTTMWTAGVNSSGTFTKASSMNDWSSGVNGIPSGWTVQNA